MTDPEKIGAYAGVALAAAAAAFWRVRKALSAWSKTVNVPQGDPEEASIRAGVVTMRDLHARVVALEKELFSVTRPSIHAMRSSLSAAIMLCETLEKRLSRAEEVAAETREHLSNLLGGLAALRATVEGLKETNEVAMDGLKTSVAAASRTSEALLGQVIQSLQSKR